MHPLSDNIKLSVGNLIQLSPSKHGHRLALIVDVVFENELYSLWKLLLISDLAPMIVSMSTYDSEYKTCSLLHA